MGWWPFGHVLRARNPQLWHETASNHLADFAISVCTLARGRAHRVALALAQPLIESAFVAASRRQDPLGYFSTLPRRHSCLVSPS